MKSQKGYTAIEAVLWTSITTVVVGSMFLFEHMLYHSHSPSRALSEIAESLPTTSLPPLPVQQYRKNVRNEIIAMECDELDCGAALKAFEHKYRKCNIVPLGPFTVAGYTVRYYFLVSGTP